MTCAAAALAAAAAAQVIPSTDAQARDRDVIVALVDSGADIWDLKARELLWVNERDPIDGIDDDNNGFVDDHLGWDFSGPDPDPFDWPSISHGVPSAAGDAVSHGTAMSEIIEFAAREGKPHLRLMILRVTDSTVPIEPAVIIEALKYAVQNGADIINLSIGGDWGLVASHVRDLAEQNDEFVAVVSSGNDGEEIYPESPEGQMCGVTRVICVASVDRSGRRLGAPTTASNYGSDVVDLAAFGGPVTTMGRRLAVSNLRGALAPESPQGVRNGGVLQPTAGMSCAVSSRMWRPREGSELVEEVRAGERVPEVVADDPSATAACPSRTGSRHTSQLEGTSVAAAQAAGELTRRLAKEPSASRDEFVRRFLSSLRSVDDLASRVHDGRVLMPRRSPGFASVATRAVPATAVPLLTFIVFRSIRSRRTGHR